MRAAPPRPRPTVIAMLLLLVAAFAANAPAQPKKPPTAERRDPAKEKAEKSYQTALDLYRDGQYRAAIEHLEKARILDPKAKELPYNLGLVYEKLGELDDAIKFFELTITLETDEAERERLRGTVRRLEGARRDLRAAAVASAAVSASAAPPPPPPSAELPAPRRPRGRLDAVVYGLGGLSLAALAAGTFLGLKALSQKPNNPLTGQGATSYANLQATADSAHNNAVWADISFAVALASGGAAAFLYFSREAQPAPVVGALVPTRGGAMGSLEVAF